MKHLQFLGLLLCVVCQVACQTGEEMGNQEAKRHAAVARQQQQTRGSEADQNLQSAQENILNRDSNPARKY
jgi:hypothetical protein